MQRQCAGCGTVYEDGVNPKGPVSPRPYGCCDECNKTSFRTHEQNEVKLKAAPAAPVAPAAPAETTHVETLDEMLAARNASEKETAS